MFDQLKTLLDANRTHVEESFLIPARTAQFSPIPRFLFNSRTGLYLHREIAKDQGLWRHQALALERLSKGHNVVVSTATASGKSLIFMSAVFHEILLDRRSRAIVFYPLKALAADQLTKWRDLAADLELDQSIVSRIDGSVPTQEREAILESSRIILMTPDVCHAWLMSRLALGPVKRFLSHLRFIVLDEAHTLEGVFGSNFSFLLRRLYVARNVLVNDADFLPMQIIASTATIANPKEHLEALASTTFHAIDSDSDGSPHEETLCVHLSCNTGDELEWANEIQGSLLQKAHSGGFITFIDSRKAVERLAAFNQRALQEMLGSEAVMPYRAGYDAEDRQRIERRLQTGDLRGVIATSALELGIDLPHLTVGLNIGVPSTRKAYQQRLGRIGRQGKGGFVILASKNAFRAFGTSYKQYHELSVEQSYLYLDNRFMQFAHARCLADELESLGAPISVPAGSKWPPGFRKIFSMTRPGGDRPTEFDSIAQIGGDTPQYNYPLRNVGEINFKISQGEHAPPFGEATEAQAIRECYPGAVYYHMAHPYQVRSWQTAGLRPYIRVKPTHPGRSTKPRIRTWINTGIAASDLLDNHLLSSEDGFLAETHMQITERVEGFSDEHGTYHSYMELRQHNPNMRPRYRNFRTTGALLCIHGEWFRKGGVKQTLADWIMKVFCREFSVLPQDIGAAATNISVRTLEGGGVRGDCLVLFDQTYGSLRLTEKIFVNIDLILDRLQISAESEEGSDRIELLSYVEALRKSIESFSDQSSFQALQSMSDREIPEGLLHVFTPGSTVYYREAGMLGTEVTIIRPTIMEGQLMYQVRAFAPAGGDPILQWVSGGSVEPSADAGAWAYGLWNPQTEEFVENEENELD